MKSAKDFAIENQEREALEEFNDLRNNSHALTEYVQGKTPRPKDVNEETEKQMEEERERDEFCNERFMYENGHE